MTQTNGAVPIRSTAPRVATVLLEVEPIFDGDVPFPELLRAASGLKFPSVEIVGIGEDVGLLLFELVVSLSDDATKETIHEILDSFVEKMTVRLRSYDDEMDLEIFTSYIAGPQECATWSLRDGAKIAAEHPDTFERPSASEIEAIAPGDFVKLMFDVDGEGSVERMWVNVAEVTGPTSFIGTLSNQAAGAPLTFGAPVSFEHDHVISFMAASEMEGLIASVEP